MPAIDKDIPWMNVTMHHPVLVQMGISFNDGNSQLLKVAASFMTDFAAEFVTDSADFDT